MARKRTKKSKPTTSRRNRKQKLKGTYGRVREAAQLAGLIPTTPEGALKDERVDPKTQGQQELPQLDRAAVSRGWAVPDEGKAKVVERLLEPFKDTTKEPDRYLLEKNAKVLLIADQKQWERDNPQLAGQAKGGFNQTNNTQVNNAVVVDPLKLVQLMREVETCEVEARIAEVKAIEKPTAPHTNGTANGKAHHKETEQETDDKGD